jgi:hypothetical protein
VLNYLAIELKAFILSFYHNSQVNIMVKHLKLILLMNRHSYFSCIDGFYHCIVIFQNFIDLMV